MSKEGLLFPPRAIDRRTDRMGHLGVNQFGSIQKLERQFFVAEDLNDAPTSVGFLVIGDNGFFKNPVLRRCSIARCQKEVVMLTWYFNQYLHGQPPSKMDS